MSTELLGVLVGGPGMVALVVAIIGFLQNRRTLRASQPKTDAEKMQIEIQSLRELLAETREVRRADKSDFEYRIAELKAELEETRRQHKEEMRQLYHRISKYLDEHAIPKPHWWPWRHPDRPLESDDGDI